MGESTCRNVPYRVVQFSQSVLKQMTNSFRECSQIKRMAMLVVPLKGVKKLVLVSHCVHSQKVGSGNFAVPFRVKS